MEPPSAPASSRIWFPAAGVSIRTHPSPPSPSAGNSSSSSKPPDQASNSGSATAARRELKKFENGRSHPAEEGKSMSKTLAANSFSAFLTNRGRPGSATGPARELTSSSPRDNSASPCPTPRAVSYSADRSCSWPGTSRATWASTPATEPQRAPGCGSPLAKCACFLPLSSPSSPTCF